MKYFAAIIALMLIFVPVVMAENVGNANWDTDLGNPINELREEVGQHQHEYSQYRPDYEMGIGLDLVVFENETGTTIVPDAVTIENKYDFSNENGSTYVVAKYNIWERMFKNQEK